MIGVGPGAVLVKIINSGYGGGLDVCVYKNIATDKSFSIMIIVPDAAVSTSVRTTPELELEPRDTKPASQYNK